MTPTIEAERRIDLSFTEKNYPGWREGDPLPNPYLHPSGRRYQFSGTAVVEKVSHAVGAMVAVEICHYPKG